ncbi:hypothetical protein [Pelagibacterium limicola]|uniref:hypothetical protein n=1 Tax=Pelagibacterium limicola TaxID=2791022 RepID=UPI0018AF554A|nr:hypothetical protein [Pelagibacterium limicola]
MLTGISKILGSGALALALSACSMGSMFGGNDDAQFAGATASQAQVAQGASTAVPAIATECPPIRIREGAGSHRAFTGNRTSDPQALRYQSVIDRISRNCTVANGVITIRMGAVGRVILGPQGQAGNVNVPLRFAVERDGLAVFSQRYDLAVSASPSTPNEFSHTVENVTVPYVGGETITIWVGFDT